MHTNKKENLRKTIKRKPTAPPVWARDPGPGPGLPGPRPWGCCRLAFYGFPFGFLAFWYAYALIGLEIIIRLDLISNVCIIIPDLESELVCCGRRLICMGRPQTLPSGPKQLIAMNSGALAPEEVQDRAMLTQSAKSSANPLHDEINVQYL